MANNPSKPFVYVIAGEPSGDVLGGQLMQALAAQTDGNIRFEGVGGPEMIEQGLDSLFPMSELSVMGIAEVLPQIPRLLGRISDVVKDVIRCQPDIVISIDAPDFSFRVAKRLKGKGIPLVHYVAPTVWAWRPGRARKVAKFLDHLLCLFPFEPPYFEKEGLSASFVGHPVIASAAVGANGRSFRDRHNLPANAPVLAVLPGSRLGEVSRHLPIFRETVERLSRDIEGLRLISVTTGPVAEIVKTEMATWAVPCLVIDDADQKYDAMAAANAALAASGTVALELAAVGTPAVIAYQMNWLTVWIGKRLVKAKYASLINILLDDEIMPECLIDKCRADVLAPKLAQLMQNTEIQEKQQSAFDDAMAQLSPGGDQSPSEKAAEIIFEIINGSKLA